MAGPVVGRIPAGLAALVLLAAGCGALPDEATAGLGLVASGVSLNSGARCTLASDCQSGVCSLGYCRAPTCFDGVMNGVETGQDCGGGCQPCAAGACVVGGDCRSHVCLGGTCADPSCTDGVWNGTETDLDCGGSCGPCAMGGRCTSGDGCVSGLCQRGYCIVAGTCADNHKDGTETAVDCGGACGPCATAAACVLDRDCHSRRCVLGQCAAPSCSDGRRNGVETAIDCGGTCGGCATGRACKVSGDCQSHDCHAGYCAPGASDLCTGITCAPLDGCHTAGVCNPATGVCTNPAAGDGAPCSDGDACTTADACQAGVCVGTPGGCAATFDVTQHNFAFSPPSLTIHPGDTVRWTNIQGYHGVAADDGSFTGPFGVATPPYSHTYDSPGTYHYYCPIHGAPGAIGESGVVTVE